MASIRLIKRRIKSAQNISQITRAMEMVAASKMKKAQELAVLGKPYAERIYQATKELAQRTEKKLHPLLSDGNPDGKILVIVVSTNKGLCGGLNTNLFRMIHTWYGKEKKIEYVTVGKKGESFVVKSGRLLVADFSSKVPFITNVPAIAKFFVDGFIQGAFKEIHIIFNSYLNALKQIPVRKIILPLTMFENTQSKPDDRQVLKFSEFVIEPSPDDILDNLLPHYLENQIRAAILESEASEHSARMLAMKNATDAAQDFMEELTLVFNKARQEKITYEIADMVTARMSVDV